MVAAPRAIIGATHVVAEQSAHHNITVISRAHFELHDLRIATSHPSLRHNLDARPRFGALDTHVAIQVVHADEVAGRHRARPTKGGAVVQLGGQRRDGEGGSGGTREQSYGKA